MPTVRLADGEIFRASMVTTYFFPASTLTPRNPSLVTP